MPEIVSPLNIKARTSWKEGGEAFLNLFWHICLLWFVLFFWKSQPLAWREMVREAFPVFYRNLSEMRTKEEGFDGRVAIMCCVWTQCVAWFLLIKDWNSAPIVVQD